MVVGFGSRGPVGAWVGVGLVGVLVVVGGGCGGWFGLGGAGCVRVGVGAGGVGAGCIKN